MDKEKEIEELENELIKIQHGSKPCCIVSEMLVEAGYGNIKQAIKEFAERLKEKSFFNPDFPEKGFVYLEDVNVLIQELYGKEQT